MAVYVYGLDSDAIAAEIPGLDASSLGASTEPISTTDLTQWIEDGASYMNSTLAKSSITASSSLDEAVHARCKDGVKAYAVSKALLVMNRTGAVYDKMRTIWEQALAQVSSRPEELGGEFSPTVTSNDTIKTSSSDITEAWSFIGFTGENNW